MPQLTGRKRHPVRGSKTGRPIMALFDLLGRRWVLRIVWELRGEPMTWRTLRAACDNVSPSVLQQRLDDLRRGRIVELIDGRGYALTGHGRDLLAALAPVDAWAKRWGETVLASDGKEYRE